WAIGAMLVVILIYDQLLFRPLVAWGARFRIDQEPSDETPESWVLTLFRRSRYIDALTAPFAAAMRRTWRLSPPARSLGITTTPAQDRIADLVWNGLVFVIAAYAGWSIIEFTRSAVTLGEIAEAAGLGVITLLRVVVL